MLAKASTCAVIGLKGALVEVEVDIGHGLPAFAIVGLPNDAVNEAKERVRATIKNSGGIFPLRRITVNLAPADLREAGPAYDLPIAIAILMASEQIAPLDMTSGAGTAEGCLFLGELSPEGSMRHTHGILPMVSLARDLGLRAVFVLAVDAAEARERDAVVAARVEQESAQIHTQLAADESARRDLARLAASLERQVQQAHKDAGYEALAAAREHHGALTARIAELDAARETAQADLEHSYAVVKVLGEEHPELADVRDYAAISESDDRALREILGAWIHMVNTVQAWTGRGESALQTWNQGLYVPQILTPDTRGQVASARGAGATWRAAVAFVAVCCHAAPGGGVSGEGRAAAAGQARRARPGGVMVFLTVGPEDVATCIVSPNARRGIQQWACVVVDRATDNANDILPASPGEVPIGVLISPGPAYPGTGAHAVALRGRVGMRAHAANTAGDMLVVADDAGRVGPAVPGSGAPIVGYAIASATQQDAIVEVQLMGKVGM
jgi:hypothetical protein